ncbi:methyltransferase domain protein [Ceratobasidium sp. AG-Ba]|nr:methyltransferase domain protein [Ceratobasidium sp. AG-Ba]
MAIFSYYDTETDAIVYHVIPSSDTDYAPSTISSETDSTLSGTTIRSDDLPGYFVLHHGRQQPASKNLAKWYPSDNIRRYVVRYLVSRSTFGGDYIGPVKEVLAPLRNRERHVLELGTRTGTWIQAMAAEFPHVWFRTLDVVPIMPHVPRHNVIFEAYDFTEGLRVPDESQDAVFLNIVMELVKDYKALLREAYRVLRPGGLIHINDFKPNFWEHGDISRLAERTNPMGCQFNRIIRQQVASAGIDPDTIDRLPEWLTPESKVWNQGQSGFKDIYSDKRTYPFFPHDGHSCMDSMDPSMAPLYRHFAAACIRDMAGLVRDSGMESEEVDRLIEGVLQEAERPEGCVVIKVCCIYATKIAVNDICRIHDAKEEDVAGLILDKRISSRL